MMKNLYSWDETFALLKAAGCFNATAEILTAIAFAEAPAIDGGKQFCDMGAVGDVALADSTWGYSFSAWQIRSLRRDKGTGRQRDELKLIYGDFAAKAAREIVIEWRGKSRGNTGYEAWSTYRSGAYLGYLQHAQYNEVPALPAGVYRVTGGDSLSGIGGKTGYRWQDIAKVNRIPGPQYLIFPGQTLELPDFPYVVLQGDTVQSISESNHLTVARLTSYNKLAGPVTPGQTLNIPRIP